MLDAHLDAEEKSSSLSCDHAAVTRFVGYGGHLWLIDDRIDNIGSKFRGRAGIRGPKQRNIHLP